MGYSAEEVLLEMYDHFSQGLEEIVEKYRNESIPDFARGTKNAYIEILEAIQKWKHAEENGFDWEVEEVFPPE